MFIRGFISLCLVVLLLGIPTPTQAAGVVTNCSNQSDLQSKLAGGGLVTFSCGASPVTITITSTLEITAANTTIDGGGLITLQGSSGVRMILHRTLTNVASTLTLRNLTIRNASISGNAADANGAAIRSVNNSFSPPDYPQVLNIENVSFIDNTSNQTGSSGNGYDYGGGAIFTQGGFLNVRNSTFTNNRSLRGAGGAIHGLRSNISIEDSTFTSNQATPYNSSNTSSGYGGALYVDGALSSGNGYVRINNSTFTNNTAANQGGFAYVNLYTAQGESLTINGSRFVGNSVSGGGMGLGGALSGGGTGSTGSAYVTITNSLFHNNTVAGGSTGASGGALAFAQKANIVIANSTFVGNEARGVCSNCFNANGGAIYIVNNPVPYIITNITAVNNYAGWVGGGITASTSGVLRNSIIANNTAENGGNGWNIQQNCGQQIASGSHNLQFPALNPNDSNDRRCTAGITIANPLLGSLSDNGGGSLTVPLLSGSPAINTADNNTCTAAPINNLDQRGMRRLTPSNTLCDIGAFEANAVTAGDTIGVYRITASAFFLRNANLTGMPDLSLLFGGLAGDLPVVGDWNGDGVDTIGIYRSTTGEFFLKDSNAAGAPIAYSFVLGNPGDMPMAGDWDGDGRDGVGVFRPSNGLIYIKSTLTTGFADFTMVLGNPGDVPVAGDWNGNGSASPGVFRPSLGQFFLTNQVCNCIVFADFDFTFGAGTDLPFTGDWNGNGTSGVGVFRPSTGQLFLRNALSTGTPDITLLFGASGDRPVGGKWATHPLVGDLMTDSAMPDLAPTFVPRQ
ncbi:MAG: hypothetical protein DYG88_15465 [Chloroflexi bacterium CFX4]|nr:hypothetical protein [Chloroflexi bacterium CFX4]MDL1924187.1 hypothetical protein [Chloroflexi bacterium CFX3]